MAPKRRKKSGRTTPQGGRTTTQGAAPSSAGQATAGSVEKQAAATTSKVAPPTSSTSSSSMEPSNNDTNTESQNNKAEPTNNTEGVNPPSRGTPTASPAASEADDNAAAATEGGKGDKIVGAVAETSGSSSANAAASSSQSQSSSPSQSAVSAAEAAAGNAESLEASDASGNNSNKKSSSSESLDSNDNDDKHRVQQPQQQQNYDLILTSEKLRGVYECDYCRSDISQAPRIRCAVCPDFDLCLDCFATTDHAAASAASSRNGGGGAPTKKEAAGGAAAAVPLAQGYRVCDSTRFPIFGTSSIAELALKASNSRNNNNSKTDSSRVCEKQNDAEDAVATDIPGATTGTEKKGGGQRNDSSTAEMMEVENGTSSNNNNAATAMDVDGDAASSSNKRSAAAGDDGDNAFSSDDELDKRRKKRRRGIDDERATTMTASAIAAANSKDAEAMTTAPITAPAGESSADCSSAVAAATIVDLQDQDPKNIWTAEEDLRLLEGIKTHGLGNWVDIAEAVGGQGSTGKTSKRCMERYFDDYLGRYGHILPPYTLEEVTPAAAAATTTTVTKKSDETAAGKETTAHTNSSVESGSRSGGSANEAPDGEGSNNVDEDENSNINASKAKEEEGAPVARASKRRSTMLRNPSTLSLKKYKVIPTESTPGYEELWPNPYLPTIKRSDNDNGSSTTAPVRRERGQEVGREQMLKAENAYVKMISALESMEEAEKVRKEWIETKLNRPGGPSVLPPRADEVLAMPGGELVGFMPRRGDFDVEWDNNAEKAVADMEFIPGESPADKELKMQVLEIYSSKLNEREKRKQFVLSRKLYDYRKNQMEEQKLPRDERDLIHRMRLFARFHTPEEHDKFIADLLKAKRLRKEIAKLQTYRRLGIRSLAEAEKYELDKSRRAFHQQKEIEVAKAAATASTSASPSTKSATDAVPVSKVEESVSSSLWKQYRTSDRKARKSINRGSSSPSAVAEGLANSDDKKNEGTDNANGETAQKEKIDSKVEGELESAASNEQSKGTAMDVDKAPNDTKPDESTSEVAVTDTKTDESTSKVAVTDTKTDESTSKVAVTDTKTDESTAKVAVTDIKTDESTSKVADAAAGDTAADAASGDASGSGLGETPNKEGDGNAQEEVGSEDITQLPGYQLLSPQEADLCRKVDLKPRQYLDIKKALIYESLQQGLLDKEGHNSGRRTIVKIDVERRGDVVDFMVRAGWISTKFGNSTRNLSSASSAEGGTSQ